MKTAKPVPLNHALGALKRAILEGATGRYERLAAMAVQAGASEEQIDHVAQEAIEELFAQAEKPVSQRYLAQLWPTVHFRH
ncbi:MAG TPA: hypothetical protein VL486_01805 [Verrucomicrobiae bacterium]|nr:hypothetical protein [Verrucomicrobiae bacterium]